MNDVYAIGTQVFIYFPGRGNYRGFSSNNQGCSYAELLNFTDIYLQHICHLRGANDNKITLDAVLRKTREQVFQVLFCTSDTVCIYQM
jgi:hypothetical protein